MRHERRRARLRRRRRLQGLLRLVVVVALVLGVIQGLEKLVTHAVGVHRLPDPGVMPCGDQVSSHGHGVIQESLELDFSVAQDIRIGRAPGRIFAQKIREDPILVLGGEVDGLDIDADDVGHAGCVEPILARRAVLGIVVVLPVLHEEAKDVIALLLEQPGRDRGVNATGHSDHDPLFCGDFLIHDK